MDGVKLVKLVLKEFGPQPQKKLQKLAYLAEIEYIKKHGKRLSDLSFKRYYYGPYSEDIKNIEDLEEDIRIIEDHKTSGYHIKESSLISGDKYESIVKEKVANEVISLIKQYSRKSGKELEKIADNTEPFLETEEMNDPIDLNSYAWFYSLLNSKHFWEEAEKKDKENREKNVYGKHVIRDESELDELFS
ncbi:MAG: Panacea domain-containing protein [Candidatus Thermoplasmatota archaeon]|nr:Panacea domain-containing protein [Candidatus Thermoplasmatota archaeon]